MRHLQARLVMVNKSNLDLAYILFTNKVTGRFDIVWQSITAPKPKVLKTIFLGASPSTLLT